MADATSTRALSRASGGFVRSTPGSQSLERGLCLLRTFRVGGSVLTNAELAARTGLPRPTVSRLARSLVDAGFLDYDHLERGYRLGAVCLSLALSFRSDQRALELALPLMRRLAEGRRINVGLAVLDGTEMIYLDSVRQSRLGIYRRLVPGSRIPAALTSLGRAYLAGMRPAERRVAMQRLARERARDWPVLRGEIQAALCDVRERGFCVAQWQSGALALAVPVREPAGRHYALNLSFGLGEDTPVAAELRKGELLLELATAIEASWRVALPALPE